MVNKLLDITQVYENVRVKGNNFYNSSGNTSGLCGIILRMKLSPVAMPYINNFGLCLFRVHKKLNNCLYYKDFSLYASTTSADDNTPIINLKDLKPEVSDIICYTDIKADGYVYVYLRATGDNADYSVQILHAPYITGFDAFYNINFDTYPSDFISIGHAVSYKPTLNWEENASYNNIYNLTGEVFEMDCMLWKHTSVIPEDTVLLNTKYAPSQELLFPATLISKTYGKIHPCILKMDVEGNLKLCGLSDLSDSDLYDCTLNVSIRYKTTVK